MIIEFLKKLLGIKKEAPPYPEEFCIIDYSPIALERNILNAQNKVIYRNFYDDFGNLITKKYRYSVARLKSLKEIAHMPIFDKTQEEPVFPVFAKILPSEISYKTTE